MKEETVLQAACLLEQRGKVSAALNAIQNGATDIRVEVRGSARGWIEVTVPAAYVRLALEKQLDDIYAGLLAAGVE